MIKKDNVDIINMYTDLLVMKGFDPFFSRGVAYFAVSSCMSDVITYKIRDKEYRPNLYLGLSSIAGIGKKSSLMEEVLEIYRSVMVRTSKNPLDEEDGIVSDYSSAEGVLRKLQQLNKIIFDADEFDQLLKSMGDKGDYRAHTMSTLNSLYYGKYFHIVRSKEDIVIKKGKVVLMLFGMHRPKDYFGKEHLRSGFMRRLLVLMLFNKDIPKIDKAEQYTEDDYYDLENTLIRNVTEKLVEVREKYMKNKHVIKFNQEIRQFLADLYIKNHNAAIEDETLTSFLGIQYEELLTKLTALEAIARGKETATESELYSAKEFLDKVMERWGDELRIIAHERKERVYEEDELETEIFKYIDNDNEGFCKWKDIRQRYSRMNKRDLVIALEKLYDQDKIQVVAAKRRKPTLLFFSKLDEDEVIKWMKQHQIKSIKDKDDKTKYIDLTLINEDFKDYFE